MYHLLWNQSCMKLLLALKYCRIYFISLIILRKFLQQICRPSLKVTLIRYKKDYPKLNEGRILTCKRIDSTPQNLWALRFMHPTHITKANLSKCEDWHSVGVGPSLNFQNRAELEPRPFEPELSSSLKFLKIFEPQPSEQGFRPTAYSWARA